MNMLTAYPIWSLLSANCPAHCPEAPRSVPLSNLGHKWSDPDNPLTCQKTSSHSLQNWTKTQDIKSVRGGLVKICQLGLESMVGKYNAHRDREGEMREPCSSWKTDWQSSSVSFLELILVGFCSLQLNDFLTKTICRVRLTWTLYQEVSRPRT